MNNKINKKNLKELIKSLINIYSPSGKEEKIQRFLYNYLKKDKLPVKCQPVDDYRYNVLVIPDEIDIEVVLMGHIDTVAAYELDSFGYEEEGDTIYGLGAADMKANCGAMIEAYIKAWKEFGKSLPAGLALVVGEEEEGDGARELVQEYHFPWAVIGEPTDLSPCLCHYGYMEAQLCTRGKKKHASLADPEHNAIENMLDLLLELSHYLKTNRPEILYNIRELFSSRRGFVVPDTCEAWLDFHLPPKAPLGEITFELEEILTKKQEKKPSLNASLRFETIDYGYELPERGGIIETLKEIFERKSIQWESRSFRSHSDANVLWPSGIKPVILGAGKLEKAHIPEESISFEQTHLMSEIYFDLLSSLRTG